MKTASLAENKQEGGLGGVTKLTLDEKMAYLAGKQTFSKDKDAKQQSSNIFKTILPFLGNQTSTIVFGPVTKKKKKNYL